MKPSRNNGKILTVSGLSRSISEAEAEVDNVASRFDLEEQSLANLVHFYADDLRLILDGRARNGLSHKERRKFRKLGIIEVSRGHYSLTLKGARAIEEAT